MKHAKQHTNSIDKPANAASKEVLPSATSAMNGMKLKTIDKIAHKYIRRIEIRATKKAESKSIVEPNHYYKEERQRERNV